MKKEDFLKWFNILAEEGRINLVLSPYGTHPMSMHVIALEVKNDTKLGKSILKQL